MTKCLFRYCNNSTKNVSSSSGIGFHRFPSDGHPKREEWIEIIQKDRNENEWLPTPYSLICSDHFKKEDFYITKTGKRFLRKSAIPCCNLSDYTDVSLTALLNVEFLESDGEPAREEIMKKKLTRINTLRKILTKKAKKIQRQNRYLQQKFESLTETIKLMKKKKEVKRTNINNKGLEKKAGEVAVYTDTLRKIKKTGIKLKYSPSIRKFSLTSSYCSPAAIKYCQQFFQKALPYSQTIEGWFEKINAESLET